MRKQQSDVVDTGVLAVTDAKAISHVDVSQLRKLIRKRPTLSIVFGRLSPRETEVLKKRDLTIH
jgi:hypothetical protein